MSTCRFCGEEITFRRIDGRNQPIHPNGGWECNWSSKVEYADKTSKQYRPEEVTDTNFTVPSNCPVCKKDVYFIRYNGGSVWVDPPLGWPWPKHACFDDPHEPSRSFSLRIDNTDYLKDRKLGIIAKIGPACGPSEIIFLVRFPDLSRIAIRLEGRPPPEFLIGAFVIVSQGEKRIVIDGAGEYSIRDYLILPSTDVFGYYTCPRCNDRVREGSNHNELCFIHGRSPTNPSIWETPASKYDQASRQWFDRRMLESDKHWSQMRMSKASPKNRPANESLSNKSHSPSATPHPGPKASNQKPEMDPYRRG